MSEAKNENDRDLLLFKLGPVQEFIAQAAEVSDLWAGSYLLSSLILAGERVVPGWEKDQSGKDVNKNFVFPNFSDSTVVDAMEGADRIPTIPNRFLVWVPKGEGRKVAEHLVKTEIRRKLDELAKGLPVGAEEQIGQFAQMSFAALTVPYVTERMGEYYQQLGEKLAARCAVREFRPWTETVATGPKDFLSGKETALKDGLGAMNLIKRNIYKSVQETKHIQRFRGKADTYIAVIAMDGDKMGRNLSKFKKAEEHQTFSGALAKFASSVGAIVNKHQGELIYAGGDDVLAVTDAKAAIECARELREEFGKIKGADGKSLTASAGIAVGHEKVPLQELIHAAHSAESRAKGSYGRDALALSVFKHSGEILEWGCNWDSKAFSVIEAIVADRGGLPARFPYKLAELLAPYGEIKADFREVVKLEFEHAWERSVFAAPPTAIKEAADAYLAEACDKDRVDDFLSLFLCDTFIARKRDKKGGDKK